VSGQASLATPLFDPGAPLAEDPSAVVRGLYWLTVDAAYGPPQGEDPAGLLIEVDDAQWSDRPSLAYLAYLAARISELPAEKAADALAGARILAPGEPLSFTHPLIAASVVADIPAFARSRAHRRAADLLAADGASCDSIAAHLLRGGRRR
jgi:hypothetical protein